jgi:hypothetical protein
MVAFFRGTGQILRDVTVNTTYVHSINFVAPGSRDMHDATDKGGQLLVSCSVSIQIRSGSGRGPRL